MSDFVNFKISQKLKEKGFDWETSDVYERNTIACRYEDYPKPTIYQALKWLREEKKLYVGVTYSPKIEGSQDFYYATIQYIGDYKKTIYPDDNYDSWKEAALAGIKYVLDNLI